jgi:Arm domain-containing DNA-binding protein
MSSYIIPYHYVPEDVFILTSIASLDLIVSLSHGHHMVTKGIAMPKSTSRITKRAVDGAGPRPGRYVVWDSELKGFGIRIAESGTKTYFVRYRPRGLGQGAPKRFVVLGRHSAITPDEARNRARAILGAVAASQDRPKSELVLTQRSRSRVWSTGSSTSASNPNARIAPPRGTRQY